MKFHKGLPLSCINCQKKKQYGHLRGPQWAYTVYAGTRRRRVSDLTIFCSWSVRSSNELATSRIRSHATVVSFVTVTDFYPAKQFPFGSIASKYFWAVFRRNNNNNNTHVAWSTFTIFVTFLLHFLPTGLLLSLFRQKKHMTLNKLSSSQVLLSTQSLLCYNFLQVQSRICMPHSATHFMQHFMTNRQLSAVATKSGK